MFHRKVFKEIITHRGFYSDELDLNFFSICVVTSQFISVNCFRVLFARFRKSIWYMKKMTADVV